MLWTGLFVGLSSVIEFFLLPIDSRVWELAVKLSTLVRSQGCEGPMAVNPWKNLHSGKAGNFTNIPETETKNIQTENNTFC